MMKSGDGIATVAAIVVSLKPIQAVNDVGIRCLRRLQSLLGATWEDRMTVYEKTIAEIHQMPEPLVQEVGNYVDFLLTRSDGERWQTWLQFSEAMELAESDITDYRRNLENYEEQLARGEVKW